MLLVYVVPAGGGGYGGESLTIWSSK